MLTLEQSLALFGGALTMMVQGSLYVFGTITPYIASYLYYEGDKDITINSLQIIVTISVVCLNAGMILPKASILKFDNRITALISITGIAASVFAISFTTSFTVYILLYGVCFGISIGFGYVAPIKNCIQHLPNKKGLCSGVCIMGFGLGALLFNLILLELINPENEKVNEDKRFSKQIAENLPSALKIISAIYLGMGYLGAILIRPIKKNQKEKSLLVSEAMESNISEEEDLIRSEKQYKQVESTKQAFLDKKLYVLTAIISLSMPYGGFVAFYFKEYGLTSINDDHFLTILASIGSIVNGLSRFFWGFLLDRISFKWITTIMGVIYIISCSTIYLAVESKALYSIVILMTYFVYGGNFGIYPTQTVRILGPVKGAKYYWITFGGFSIGSVIQLLFHYTLVKQFGNDGFMYCFFIFLVLLFISLIVAARTQFEYHPSEKKYVKGNDLEPQKILCCYF